MEVVQKILIWPYKQVIFTQSVPEDETQKDHLILGRWTDLGIVNNKKKKENLPILSRPA